MSTNSFMMENKFDATLWHKEKIGRRVKTIKVKCIKHGIIKLILLTYLDHLDVIGRARNWISGS